MKKLVITSFFAIFVLIALSNCATQTTKTADAEDLYVFTNNPDINRVIDCNTDWNYCIINTLEPISSIDSISFKKLLSDKTCDYEYLRCLSTERIIINTLDDFNTHTH